MTSSSFNDWPEKEALEAKLLIPSWYDPYNSSNSSTTTDQQCYLKYDRDTKRLLVLSVETGNTLDIMNPEDMIGVEMKVEMTAKAEEETVLRATKKNTSNDEDEEDTERTANNEPSSEKLVDTQATAILSLFCYPRKTQSNDGSFFSCGTLKKQPKPVTDQQADADDERNKPSKNRSRRPREAHHRFFQVAPAEDLLAITSVLKALRTLCRPRTPEEKRLLVLINPFSGTKQGVPIYETVVVPMLQQAGVEHDALVTTHTDHALERMSKKKTKNSKQVSSTNDDGDIDITEYGGIVGIGGDGIISEILNGIEQRSDGSAILSKLKIGHIGAGSSNGLAKSLTFAAGCHHSPIDYTFMVAKGKCQQADLSRYQSPSKSYLSFLSFTWGLIAEVDIESEMVRWLGPLRFDLWGAWKSLVTLRKYKAKLSYLPPGKAGAKSNSSLPLLSQPIPTDSNWVTLEEDFVLIWASHVTHAAEGSIHSPLSTVDDGIFQIFVVRGGVSRFRMAMILLGMDHGTHADMDEAEFIQCTAYRLEPISKGSINDLDGEVIEDGPVQGQIFPQSLQVYCSSLSSAKL